MLREDQSLTTEQGLQDFRQRLAPVREFHKRYPNEPVENLERAYRAPAIRPDGTSDIDNMFTGEEAFGRYFDLSSLHAQYNNIRGKRTTYLQYLDQMDAFEFTPQKEKMREDYFAYLSALAQYLETFMRRTRPLQDTDAMLTGFDKDFREAWENGSLKGWESQTSVPDGPVTQGTGAGTWCEACQKEITNDNVYKAHLTAKKHLRNVEALKTSADSSKPPSDPLNSDRRLKERAVAERETLIQKLCDAMKLERDETRTNVERKQGMTDKERAQEIASMYADSITDPVTTDAAADDEEEKLYNPLKLPLQWDGKPIPFWLYKLHGLGVEFDCEICGNYIYMGRRAFEKHFSEARHLYALKCLGITNSGVFRDITKIADAEALWEKVKKDKRLEAAEMQDVEQMEDLQGNVMPAKVYQDLLKQGLL